MSPDLAGRARGARARRHSHRWIDRDPPGRTRSTRAEPRCPWASTPEIRAETPRVGIIGMRVAMETRLYGAGRHAEVVAPPADLLLQVHDAYTAMAITGTVTEAQRELFFSAGRLLVEDLGAEAVLLGGTDLGLASAGRDPGFRTFDCAVVHAAAIAEVAAGRAQGGSRGCRSDVPAGLTRSEALPLGQRQ